MKQTNFKSIVHRALSTVNRNSALCIVNRAPFITLLLVLMVGVGEAWGGTTPTVLFHETFGNNTGSARAWSDTYADRSGVSDVYKDVTYTVSGAKQSKNTVGYGPSSCLLSNQGAHGSMIIGPLHVSTYSSLQVTHVLAASKAWASNSEMTLSYSTDGTNYTSVTRTGTLPTAGTSSGSNFKDQSYSLPALAQSATLYLKLEFYHYHTSKSGEIGQVYIDNLELTGVVASTKTAEKMDVTTQPTKTTYTKGETLDLSGMVVKCTYDDASTDDAYTKYTADPAAGTALNTTGQQTVTLTSTEKNTVMTSFTVTVNAPKTLSSISVTTQPNKKSYTTCETLDLTGCVVTAIYSDDSEEDVTSSCTFNPANGAELTTSVTSVAVSYNSKGTSIDNISVTQGARDTFQDDIHGNDPKYGDCNGYTIPSLDDKTKGTECAGEHYKFIGWSSSTISSGTYAEEPQGLLKAGGTHNATGATYYAVWAKEKEAE